MNVWMYTSMHIFIICQKCLGGLGDSSWYLAVAEAGVDPSEENMEAFEVPPGVFIKLHTGTWHAGPLFMASQMDFYNLELADTNVIDHNNKHFSNDKIEFMIKPAAKVDDEL